MNVKHSSLSNSQELSAGRSKKASKGEKPPATTLDLSCKGLVSIDSHFQQLFSKQFSKVASINLVKNNLKRLFEIQPERAALTVEAIDLRDNALEDVTFTVTEIQRFMPNVKDLKLNLYDEEHVDFIMKNMPQLQFLNGLEVEREEEEEQFYEREDEDEVIVLSESPEKTAGNGNGGDYEYDFKNGPPPHYMAPSRKVISQSKEQFKQVRVIEKEDLDPT